MLAVIPLLDRIPEKTAVARRLREIIFIYLKILLFGFRSLAIFPIVVLVILAGVIIFVPMFAPCWQKLG